MLTAPVLLQSFITGLLLFNEKLLPVPDIAKSWTVSPDGLAYRFKLKKGVRFFNGREVIASDFKYSFERVLDPATRSPRTWVLSRVKGAKEFMDGKASHVSGISVTADDEMEIMLNEPFSPFISFFRPYHGLRYSQGGSREMGGRFFIPRIRYRAVCA